MINPTAAAPTAASKGSEPTPDTFSNFNVSNRCGDTARKISGATSASSKKSARTRARNSRNSDSFPCPSRRLVWMLTMPPMPKSPSPPRLASD